MARAKEFSNESIAALPATGKRYEVKDPLSPGLRVIVQPSGAKSFALRYSHAGAYKKLTLGAWPQVQLVESVEAKRDRLARDPNSAAPDARSLYRAALALKATGVDPAEQRKAERSAAAAERSEDVERHLVKTQWQRYLDNAGMKPATRKRFERIFDRLKWGEKRIQNITREDVNDAIDARRAAGPHAANGVYTVLSAFFTWAEKRGAIQSSPVKTVEKPHAEKARERVLDDAEIKAIWNGCEKLGNPFGALFQMLLLTGQRRTEVAAMKFSEIDFDAKEWHLSGDRTKNEAPHVVHLSDSALAIIKAAPRFEGCDFVFTSDGETYCSGFSKAKTALDKLAPTSEPWTLHDLRRTLSTRLAKAGVPLQVAEKILNHGRGSLAGVAGTYNRYSYADERRAALAAWAATVARIVDGASNVVPMVRA
jgi:integrase